MTEHTPGPWRVDEYSRDEIEIVGPREKCTRNGTKNEWTLAQVGSPEFWDDPQFEKEDHANARLIAAAPDLLAALKLVTDSGLFSSYDDRAWDTVNDAIAKAEGGS